MHKLLLAATAGLSLSTAAHAADFTAQPTDDKSGIMWLTDEKAKQLGIDFAMIPDKPILDRVRTNPAVRTNPKVITPKPIPALNETSKYFGVGPVVTQPTASAPGALYGDITQNTWGAGPSTEGIGAGNAPLPATVAKAARQSQP